MRTGWLTEDERPAMPVTQMLLTGSRGGPVPGGVLGTALARSQGAEAREARELAAAAPDPDERAAGLIARGYLPGQFPALGLQLADTEAELAAERDKIERGQRRAARVQRDYEAGRLSPWDIARMDFDEGDPARAERLERKAERQRQQLAGLAEAVTPPQVREQDAVEQAAARARRILEDVQAQGREQDAEAQRARAQMTADRAAFYAARGRLPFASRGAAAECPGPGCETCAQCPEPCDLCAEDHRQDAARAAGGTAYEPGMSYR
jgi:hypothetical protein